MSKASSEITSGVSGGAGGTAVVACGDSTGATASSEGESKLSAVANTSAAGISEASTISTGVLSERGSVAGANTADD